MTDKGNDKGIILEEEEELELLELPEEPEVTQGRKRSGLFIWALAVVLPCYAVDQLTKWLICKKIEIGTGFNVIPGFFDIIHVRNTGAAFGMLQGIPEPIRTYFFLGVTIAAFIAIFFMFAKIKEKSWLLKLVFSLIVAGAIGNLTDRFMYSEVVDFLSFNLVKWRWPAFNLADVYISLGMIGLLLHIFFMPQDEE